jgi:hypothetical protein
MSERIQRDSAAWEAVVAVVCFVSAVFSLVIGFVLTTRWLLDAQLHPLLHAAGIVLLIIGIPMMILGGHFMDLRERKIQHGNRPEAVINR